MIFMNYIVLNSFIYLLVNNYSNLTCLIIQYTIRRKFKTQYSIITKKVSIKLTLCIYAGGLIREIRFHEKVLLIKENNELNIG